MDDRRLQMMQVLMESLTEVVKDRSGKIGEVLADVQPVDAFNPDHATVVELVRVRDLAETISATLNTLFLVLGDSAGVSDQLTFSTRTQSQEERSVFDFFLQRLRDKGFTEEEINTYCQPDELQFSRPVPPEELN